jgi:hypothetical protein
MDIYKTAQWLVPADKRWIVTLEEAEHDFYHLPCYLSLASRYDHGEPKAFYIETASGRMLIPLLVRNIPASICADGRFIDATSPYGYPGPLFSRDMSERDVINSIRHFIEFGKKAGLVTTFLRLHPFLSKKLCSAFTENDKQIKLISHGSTISIDLSLDVEELNKRLRKNHRKNIERLLKLGYFSKIDDWEDYPELIRIYHETMNRCGASDYYYFDREYFTRLRECLGTTLHLCSIMSPEGDMAGGGLVVKTGNVVQAHINATADKYLSMAPSKLMFYETRNWAKKEGARIFHLGGGVGGKRDSLFLYKRGMGTDEHHFQTIGIIHDQEMYAGLCEKWLNNTKYEVCPDSFFFPIYRNIAIDKN